MSTTIHRKDMKSSDFLLLFRFSWLILHYDYYSRELNFGTVYRLDVYRMLLPVWISTHDGWRLDRYKNYTRDAIGLEASTLRKMCRYLSEKESVLVNTLYRLSMLSVVPGQNVYEPPKFRMPFCGDILGADGLSMSSCVNGFVIEKRRAMGVFKGKGA